MIKTGKEGDKVWVWIPSRNSIVRGVLVRDYQRPYFADVETKTVGTISCPPALISLAKDKRQASEELRKAIQEDIRVRTKIEIDHLQPILDAAGKWGVGEQYVIIKR